MFRFAVTVAFVATQSAIALDDEPKLAVGKPMPKFELKGTDGKTYRLADFKGKKPFVMAWYPKADTRGCTAECKSLAESTPELKKLNLDFFGASVDTVEANKSFAEKVGAKYVLLCDPEKKAATAFGILSPRGVSKRVTIYVDKEGIVRYIDEKVAVSTHGKDVVKKAKELKLVD